VGDSRASERVAHRGASRERCDHWLDGVEVANDVDFQKLVVDVVICWALVNPRPHQQEVLTCLAAVCGTYYKLETVPGHERRQRSSVSTSVIELQLLSKGEAVKRVTFWGLRGCKAVDLRESTLTSCSHGDIHWEADVVCVAPDNSSAVAVRKGHQQSYAKFRIRDSFAQEDVLPECVHGQLKLPICGAVLDVVGWDRVVPNPELNPVGQS